MSIERDPSSEDSSQEEAGTTDQPTEPPAQSEAPESSKPPAVTPLVEFCRKIDSIFSEGERFGSFRGTSGGLFVSEELVSRTAKEFSDWRSKIQIGSASKGDPVRDLFGVAQPALQYLLDGKTCLAGYLAPCDLTQERKLPLPKFQGSLLDGKTYLHMRDPLLGKIEHLDAKVDSSGFRIILNSRKHPATIRSDVFTQIAVAMQNSRSVLKRFPSVAYAYRNCLQALVILWSEAKVCSKNKPLLVPARFAKTKDLWFLQLADLVVVQDKDGIIVECYGLRGRNFHQFLVRETDYLRQQAKGGRIGKFQLGRAPRPKAPLGSIRLERETFQVIPQAFKYFVERLGRSKELLQNFKPRYSLRDCFEVFCSVVEKSSWVNSLDIPAEHRHGDRRTNYRRNKNWIFILEGTDTISSVIDTDDRNLFGERRGNSPRRGYHERKGPHRSHSSGGRPSRRSGSDKPQATSAEHSGQDPEN